MESIVLNTGSSLKQVLKGRIAVGFLHFFAALPFPMAQAFGRSIGRLSYRLNTKDVRLARINLKTCYPQWQDKKVEEFLKKTMQQSGMLAAETAYVWLNEPKHVLQRIGRVNGEQIMKSAVDAGQGVIVILPHLGNWEMLNAYILNKYPGSAMYTPARLAAVNEIMVSGRERTGLKLEEASAKGVMGLFKKLKKGETLFILPDQEPDFKGGEFASFFDTPALTMTLISKLAHKSQCRLVFAYALRSECHDSFDIQFLSGDPEIANEDMLKATFHLNQMIELAVKTCPEQYIWTYKRFKTRPEGLPSIY